MNLKLLAALAKKAWDAAIAANKTAASTYSAEELTALETDYNAKQAAADKADKAAGKEGEVDEAGLKAIITEAVTASLKAQLPEAFKNQVTPEGVQKIVEKALTDFHEADEKAKLDQVGIKAIVDAAVKAQYAEIKKPSKVGGKGATEESDIIEIPCSWTKGNLPLYAKQLLNVMLRKDENDGIPKEMLAKGIQIGEKTVNDYRSAARELASRPGGGRYGSKALEIGSAGNGGELTPRDLSSELQRRMYLTSDVAALMAAREIDMPSQPYDLPFKGADVDFYLNNTQRTEVTDTNPETGKLTMDAQKIMGEVKFSYEVDEDSIIPILPMVVESLGIGAGRAYERVIINGDTTGTHMDSDTAVVGSAAAEKAFKGLRKLALAVTQLKSDLSTGGLSDANIRALKKSMGKYGLRVADLVWIAGPGAINDMSALAAVSTLEKYGPKATILTGELEKLLGIPIIPSEFCREDLNASGVYDGSVTSKGSLLLFRPNHFLTGRRRQFTVETFRDIKKQENVIVASFRKAMTPLETPSATIRSVVIGYNYASGM